MSLAYPARPGAVAPTTAGLPSQSLLLAFLGVATGLQFTLLKIATAAGLDETSMLLLSMVILSAILLTLLALSRSWFRPSRRHVRYFAISGMLGFVLPLGGVIAAAQYVTAGEIVLIESLTPVITLAIAMARGSEAVTPRRFCALLLGLLSVALALAAGDDPTRWLGLALALIVPLSYAGEAFYVAACWPAKLRPLQVITGEAVISALGLLPFWLWLGGDSLQAGGAGWTSSLWPIALLAPLTGVEVYLYYTLLRRTGAVQASLASFIGLAAGIGWGVLLLGESHPPATWLAACLSLLALQLALGPRVEPAATRLAPPPAA